MVWAVTFVVIVLLFIFPKQTGTILAVLIVGIGVAALIGYINLHYREKEQESVAVLVSYASDSCDKDIPLSFKVTNRSKKIVNKVSWNIIATEKDSSTNVVDYKSFPVYQGEYSTSYHSENSTPYSTDQILKPGESFSVCYKAPLVREKLSPQNLIWKVSNKYSEFQ